MEKQDYKSFLEKQHQKEMEAAIVGQRQKSDDESGGDGNNKDSNSIAPSAIAINSKKKQTTKDIVTTQGAQSISESSIGETQTKGERVSCLCKVYCRVFLIPVLNKLLY